MKTWLDALNGDPLPWLLEDSDPAVKRLALRQLLDRPADDPAVTAALAAANDSGPIAAILAAQYPQGYWVKPGAGYGPKYRGTVWQLVFLDQMGADPSDSRVQAACEYVLSHTQTASGGFAISSVAKEKTPPPSWAIHCLHGNLLRALLGFGWEDDPRVQKAIDWQSRSITGDGDFHFYRSSTCGPGFRCSANEKLPCAWGAVKAMLALARVPSRLRGPSVKRALAEGAEFLLSCDPATAAYSVAWGNSKPSGSWFKLGFPSGYVSDVLQNMEALCELGYASDPRLENAIGWLLAKQDKEGRWRNEYAYNGKMWQDVDKQGAPSKWVTLRACRVLKAVFEG